MRFICIFSLLILFATQTMALNESRVEMRVPEAFAAYGVTGKGVTVAVLDRGITWDHPDFIDANGKTRIRAMLDQSGQNFCAANNPQPVEYTEEQINQALAEGGSLGMRDAVGHGTATAGTAAGNGRGLPDRRYQGIAPEADLIIVKMTSESTPAHDDQPAQTGFNGCTDQAIDWAAAKMDELDQPAVLIINSGVQWGPMDGSGAVSRKLAAVFPQDKPGRIVVLPSGDEGSLPNHSGTGFDNTTSTIGISKASAAFGVMTAWYSGDAPADVTVRFDDGLVIGPVGPGQQQTQGGMTVVHYLPGQEFYPWTSDSGDRAVWVGGTGHATTGTFEITARGDGAGYVDLYGDVLGPNLTPIFSMTSHLVPGRLNDYASTPTAIISGDHIIRTSYVDLNGIQRNITDEGVTGGLWLKSSAGPSRDGREYGVDSTAPGQNMFAPVGPANISWNTNYTGFTSGSMSVVQLTKVSATPEACSSGSYYNAAQSGHGYVIQVVDLGGVRYVTVTWYVYLDGKQVWLLGLAPLNGNQAEIPLDSWTGAQFPPDFDTSEAVSTPWGTLTLVFEDPDNIQASWTTTQPGYSNGSLAVTRISQLGGHECIE